eukprot:Stramenopile-MAST_4_protein_4291
MSAFFSDAPNASFPSEYPEDDLTTCYGSDSDGTSPSFEKYGRHFGTREKEKRSSKEILEMYIGENDPLHEMGSNDIDSILENIFKGDGGEASMPSLGDDMRCSGLSTFSTSSFELFEEREKAHASTMYHADEELLGGSSTSQHQAVEIRPTQTAPLSKTAVGFEVGLSKPIFEGNGVMVCGTTGPVGLTKGSRDPNEGYYCIVSRLVNTTGSPHCADQGVFENQPLNDPNVYKYSLYVSNVFPVPGVVHDLTWTGMTSVALATGSALTMANLDTWIGHRGSSLANAHGLSEDSRPVTFDKIHTDDIRAVSVLDGGGPEYIATGGFDGKLLVSSVSPTGRTRM